MKINLYTWHSERELKFCPKHFIRTNTVLTNESKSWILESLNGRFFVAAHDNDSLLFDDYYPHFEDPQEALLYELTWS